MGLISYTICFPLFVLCSFVCLTVSLLSRHGHGQWTWTVPGHNFHQKPIRSTRALEAFGGFGLNYEYNDKEPTKIINVLCACAIFEKPYGAQNTNKIFST